MHALLSLLLATTAPAFTGAELAHRKAVLVEVNKAFSAADSSLPPCAGLDHASETALRIEPGRDCPIAQEFYAYLVKLDRQARDACRELERAMEATLQDPLYCAKREEAGFLDNEQKKLRELRNRVGDAAFTSPPSLASLEGDLFDGAPGKGELAHMRCALPVVIGMQFRKKQLALANKHIGHAEAALSESCSGQRVPGEDFLRYLREGI